ncbi:hypothetical protein [Paenibacillus taichungensis]|uniref:hypothetical protein n=1 Tax=Paenibacillus taichungensis TaxID=484184 RepID=UPI0039A6030F
MSFKDLFSNKIELYTVQHPSVLGILNNEKKYIATGYLATDLVENYKNMAMYLSKKIKNEVEKPIFCFVATKPLQQHIQNKDFCGFNFNDGDIIFHLKVPLKYCTVYKFDWFDYFDNNNMLLEHIIKRRADMKKDGLHCCLPYIKSQWIVNSTSLGNFQKII